MLEIKSEEIFLTATAIKNHIGKVYKHVFTFRLKGQYIAPGVRVKIRNKFGEAIIPKVAKVEARMIRNRKGENHMWYWCEAELLVRRQVIKCISMEGRIQKLKQLMKEKENGTTES